MRKILIALALLAIAIPAIAKAAALTVTNVNATYEVVAAGTTGNTQASGIVVSPALSGAASNSVTLKSSLDGKVSNLKISAGSSLTFTPAEVTAKTQKTITIAISGTVTAGQSSVLTLSGSGITTTTTTISVVAAGSGTGGNGSTGGTTSGTTGTPASSGAAGFSKSLVQNLADSTGFVYKSWRVVRGAINVLLIIALLAISFSNILRINIDTYTVKKALPNLVIGVILANASFLIVKYMTDIATAATYFFVNLDYSSGQHFSSFNNFFAGALKLLGLTTIKSTLGAAGPLLAIIFVIVAIVLILWLAFLLYFRLVAIYLLTILAPLAFVAYGIPGFEKYFKQWWQQFVKWLFILVAISAVFWLMLVIGGASQGNNSIASLLIMYVLFFMALSLPSKMGGAIIDKASKAFQQYSGLNAARKYGETKLKDTKERAGLRFQQGYLRTPLGKVMAAQAEKRKIDLENMKRDVGTLRGKASTAAREGQAGENEAATQLDEQEMKIRDEIVKLGKERLARSKKERGLKLAEAADEKKIIELGVQAQKLEEERQALLKNDTVKQQYQAELEKQRVESKKNDVYTQGQFEFFKDENNGKFLKNVFSAVNESDQIQGALKREEGIMKGNLGREELVLAKHVKDYKGLEDKYNDARGRGDTVKAGKYLNQMRGLKTEYDKIRREPGHDFFVNKTISDAAAEVRDKDSIPGAIIGAKVTQAGKATDAGVAATIEEALKTQTLQEAMEDYSGSEGIADTVRQSLEKGETVGASMKDQHVFSSHVQKLIKWSRDANDYRRDGALTELADMHIRGSGQPLIVKQKGLIDPVTKKSTIIDVSLKDRAAVENYLQTATRDEKSKILTEVAKKNRFLVASGAMQAGHFNQEP